MRITKEVRRLSRALLRASFTDGRLDGGKIGSLTESLVAKKPRHYIAILENYRRLLRLEVEKRRARIESAIELASDISSQVIQNLKRKYGQDLTTEFLVDPSLLGGMRVRVGSDVWDGTVRNRLERLEREL